MNEILTDIIYITRFFGIANEFKIGTDVVLNGVYSYYIRSNMGAGLIGWICCVIHSDITGYSFKDQFLGWLSSDEAVYGDWKATGGSIKYL